MYPTQELVIIAPIVFILLMVAFPVIGVFSGWKRALYWGGGNIVFFTIGVLIWRFCNVQICGAFVPWVSKIIEGTGVTVDITQLAISLAAPIFFLIILAGANIILVINYYAWFKKVVGIKKEIAARKEARQLKKQNKKIPNKLIVAGKLQTKQRVMNYVFGGVALGALMVPTVISATQTVYFGTTSAKTRSKNDFANNLYLGLKDTNSVFSWFSYFGVCDTFRDYDGLYGGIGMYGNKYVDPETGEQKSMIDATIEVFKDGYDVLAKVTSEPLPGAEDQEETIVQTLDIFGESWNELLNQCGEDLTPFFQSNNFTKILSDMIDQQAPTLGDKQTINDEIYDKYFAEDKIFDQVIEDYQKGYYVNDQGEIIPVTQFNQIEVDNTSFNNLKNSIMNRFENEITDPDKQAGFEERINEMMWLLLKTDIPTANN